MKIDISFQFARVYDVGKFDIVKGEKVIALMSEYDGATKWFSDNDQVLSIRQTNNDAEITANEPGLTTILIMNPEFQVQKTLTIKVVDEIAPIATDLNPTAGTAEPK